MEQSSTCRETRDAGELQSLLNTLCHSTDIGLYFEHDAGTRWPVVLQGIAAGPTLQLDATLAPQAAPRLEAGDRFWLAGQTQGSLVRTAVLRARPRIGSARNDLLFICDYPESATLLHRRTTFRAGLHRGMKAEVDLLAPTGAAAPPIRGVLKDLSLGGCLMEVPLAAAVELRNERHQARMTVRFPNGEHFRTRGYVRDIRPNAQWSAGLVGYEFLSDAPEFERLVWYFVKEIERQAVHSDVQNRRALRPSPLFSPDTYRPAAAPAPPRPASDLRRIADFLNAQTLQLQSGGDISLQPLLEHSHVLLTLLRADRDALLHASACLGDEPVLVQHSLAVAVHLADLAAGAHLEQTDLTGLVACALIHDLGKALLPTAIRRAPGALTAEQRTILHTHVHRLTTRLPADHALPADLVATVIGMANERLDSSGYPSGLEQQQLPELARMMAVVDVADAMRRARADRAPWEQMEVYRYLLRADAQFDNAWVQRYIRRFGKLAEI